MLDLATERRHLAQADRDIAEGERRVAAQADLVARMRGERGHGLAEADRLLKLLEETLLAWREHRENILRSIADLESGMLPALRTRVPPAWPA